MALLGLTELDHYRGLPAKVRALEVLIAQLRVIGLYMRPRALALVACAWVAPSVILMLARPANPLVAGILTAACWAAVLGVIIVSAAQRARPALRRDLIRMGIPVCLACGHDLRGSPGDPRCPECRADATNLEARAWEPMPEATLYPELIRFPTAAEAERALATAKARAGLLIACRRLTLILGLVGLTVLWMFAFAAADAVAFRLRQDLSRGATTALLSAAIASYPLAAFAWFTLVATRVRRELQRELARTPAGVRPNV